MKNKPLFYEEVNTAMGFFHILFTGRGIYRVCLPGTTAAEMPRAGARPLPWRDFVGQLALYAAGARVDSFTAPLDFALYSPFARQVYRVVRQIPYGETLTYRQVAEKIGWPRAARAVGQALAANRHLLVIPCHRVVGANGALGGFSAGLEWKKLLLKREGVKNRCVS